jgi:hypothetical protein
MEGVKRDIIAIHPETAQYIRTYIEVSGHREDRHGPRFRPTTISRYRWPRRRSPLAVRGLATSLRRTRHGRQERDRSPACGPWPVGLRPSDHMVGGTGAHRRRYRRAAREAVGRLGYEGAVRVHVSRPGGSGAR